MGGEETGDDVTSLVLERSQAMPAKKEKERKKKKKAAVCSFLGHRKTLGKWSSVAKSLQSCPTPCDPINSSPPGSPIPGILQARPLEWVAISFSNA